MLPDAIIFRSPSVIQYDKRHNGKNSTAPAMPAMLSKFGLAWMGWRDAGFGAADWLGMAMAHYSDAKIVPAWEQDQL